MELFKQMLNQDKQIEKLKYAIIKKYNIKYEDLKNCTKDDLLYILQYGLSNKLGGIR